MARNRAKVSRKTSNESGKGATSSGMNSSQRTYTNGYVTRKVKKPAISAQSLLSMVVLDEGITIIYSKNDDIAKIITQSEPTLNFNSIHRMWSALLMSPEPLDTNENGMYCEEVVSHANYVFNRLCLIYGNGHRATAARFHSPSWSHPENWFLFIADNVLPENVAALSEYNSSKHFLRFEDGVLRWTKSCGNMDLIRAHIDDAEGTSRVLDNLKDLEDRVVLLCAENGSGKTTLIKRLANQAKQNQPHLMVLSISLVDHAQLFDTGMLNHPLDFLKIAAGIESPSQLLSFESALDDENLVVLVDGLDEIDPKYLEKCCILFASLLQLKMKTLWIVVRKARKKYFEDQLSILATTLCEISKNDQRIMLKHFWKMWAKNKQIPNENKLDSAVNRLLGTASQTISDCERDFVGIPLQTQMMSEVFRGLVTESVNFLEVSEKLDLLDLFDRYFDKKCSVFVQSEVKLDSENPHCKVMFDTYREVCEKNHEIAALHVILTDENCKELLPREEIENFQDFIKRIKNGHEKTGIIESIVNNKPRFSHSVFVEYFAAKWFAGRGSWDTKVSNMLFMPGFENICFFFNRILARDCDLHTAVLNENLERIRTLLEDEVDVNTRDLGGRTALHLAAAHGTSEVRKVTDRRGEILDILICSTSDFEQKDNVLKGSPLQYADATQSWTSMDKLLARVADTEHLVLTRTTLKNQEMLKYTVAHDLGRLMAFCFNSGFVLENTQNVGKRLLPKSCQLGSVRVAKVLVENGANIAMNYGECDSPLHIASRHGQLAIVQLFVNAFKSMHESLCKTLSLATLDRAAVNKILAFTPLDPIANLYFKMKDEHKETAIDNAISFGYLDVVRYLLHEKAGIGLDEMVVQRAVSNSKCDARVVDIILKAQRIAGSAVCVNKTIYPTGNNAMHVAAMTGNVEIVRLVLQAGGSLTDGNKNGRPPLTVAAWYGHLDVVKYLVDHVPASKRMEHVNRRAPDGMTALQCAASYGHSDIVAYLLALGAAKGDLAHLLNLAAGNFNADPTTIEMVLDAIPANQRAQCVNTEATDTNNPLNWATLQGNIEGLEHLIKAGGNVTLRNKWQRTPLFDAASKGYVEAARLLVNNVQRHGVSKRNYINMKVDMMTAFDHAICEGHINVIEYLLSEKAKVCNEYVLMSVAVCNNRGDAKVVEIALGLIARDSRAACINMAFEGGNTALHGGVKTGNLETVVLLVENGGKISAVNNLKHTPLMIAAEKGYVRVVKYLLNKFDERKERMQKSVYINMPDRKGDKAIDLAKKNGHDGVVALITKVSIN